MRIRIHFAGAFLFLLVVAGYAGLSSLQLGVYIDDKVLHFLTFLVLTLVFYWVLDTNRRRTLHLTLAVCTGILGVGSEFVQAVLPNGRSFDIFDIVANIVGSLCGLGLCSWYHKRMLERKRGRQRGRGYSGGEGGEEEGLVEDMDIELGEGPGLGGEGVEPQDSGIVDVMGTNGNGSSSTAAGAKTRSLEQRVDEWDENDPDAWGEDDGMEEEDITSGSRGLPDLTPKKRTE
ncbi:hypothetical protein MKZ38_008837 [Zalerion maritima]|uniref:VanZ-like domain-containing protein n=1 Tax=Zalerion maritima TaxID=339359 RepID=A0AAD5RVN1_9PEZI|nr:hypothetical protein MKZ38_008837 [Zalerion maritima]